MKNLKTGGVGMGVLLVIVTIIVIVALICGGIWFFLGFHPSNSGEHSGYITSVEKEGVIWKTWKAYVKTDTQSSQEDSYCVTDSGVVDQLKAVQESGKRVTVIYSRPIWVSPIACNGEPSIIRSIK